MRAPSLTTDRSSAEIADYLLLQAINRAAALLAHLSESGILHPEDPVGSEALELDVRVEGFEPGDRYLLCSDGLTRVLTDRVLAQCPASKRTRYRVPAGCCLSRPRHMPMTTSR